MKAILVGLIFFILPLNAFAASSVSDASDSGYQSSSQIQNAVTGISPVVAKDIKPAFVVIDNARSGAANILNDQISQANAALKAIQLAQKDRSTSTEVPTLQDSQNSVEFIFWNIYLDILLALRFFINNAAISYVLLVFIFFYIIWKIYGRMSDRKRY